MKYRSSWIAGAMTGAMLLCLGLLVPTPAAAAGHITVSGPFDGALTGGNWPGTYGECFYLLPEPEATGGSEAA